jgi:2-dehydro-3-deoxygluconokinase
VTTRVASIGECMIELRERPDGLLQRSHGGDTLNTAVYLARLGIGVDYVTALGDDPWSDEMVSRWAEEGVGTGLVKRLPGQLPGLYIIETDARGERRFLYWRDSAAARQLWDHLDPAALAPFGVIYLSGITLSIYDTAARARLFDALEACRVRGARVAFDTNFRPRGWPDPAVARQLYDRMFAMADVVLASAEDLQLLFGDAGQTALLRHAPGREVVLKLDEPASRVMFEGADVLVRAEPVGRVVDTTAAGDSFSAAYLAARLQGDGPVQAAMAGHALAGVVVGYPGAIMPLVAMP